jgi:hypothetical protein
MLLKLYHVSGKFKIEFGTDKKYYMSKFWLIVLVSVFSAFICIALLLIILGMGFNKADEVVKLQNQKNGETLFLLKTAWGNDERMAIGLDNKLKEGFGNFYPEKFNTNSSFPFFYKLNNDTLFVYSASFQKPQFDNFKTHIQLIEMAPAEFVSYCKFDKYKKLGLKVFPESELYIIENFGK